MWQTYCIIKECKFPNLMKIAEISSVFKKLGNTSKDNYRSISALSNFTELFESILFLRQNSYIVTTWHIITCRILESWKVRLNNGSKVGVIITDLSKAFDSLNHELLLTKLKVGLSPSKKNFFICFNENRSKSNEKCFLFYLKSSFCSQDIKIFILNFCSCKKNRLIRKIRLILKFLTSSLDNKQLQYTYCPISTKLNETRQRNLVS